MLSGLEVRGRAVAAVAADRARRRVADALRGAIPEIAVTIEDESVVLTGRISPDDARLRWIGRLLR